MSDNVVSKDGNGVLRNFHTKDNGGIHSAFNNIDVFGLGSDATPLRTSPATSPGTQPVTGTVSVSNSVPIPTGSFCLTLTISPTISAATYATGRLLGAKMTLSNAALVSGGSGMVVGVTIADKAKQDAAIDVIFFNSDPTATTFTNNAAFAVNAADLLKIVGVARILNTDYCDFSANSVACWTGKGQQFSLAATTHLYAAAVVRGAPTYASTSDLQFKISILQD